MAAAGIELRTAMIAAAEADTGVKATTMGALPRFYNRAFEGIDFPYCIITTSSARPWDTSSDRGGEFDVEFRIRGEAAIEGDEEGEAILYALLQLFRDWAPQTFPSHRLVNLVCQYSDVRPDEGRRYMGLQRWRAVTEEI